MNRVHQKSYFEIYKSPLSENSFKFEDLEEITCSGPRISCIASRPLIGKTSFLISLALRVGILRSRKRIAFFSASGMGEEIYKRMASYISGKDARSIGFNNKDASLLLRVSYNLGKSNIYIDDKSTITIDYIIDKLNDLKKKGNIDLLIIDDFSYIINAGKFRTRRKKILAIKEISKELNSPAIITAELSRRLLRRTSKIPKLDDIRGHFIVDLLDVILLIHREDYYHETTEPAGNSVAEVIIAKRNKDPIGSVYLSFEKKYSIFKDLGWFDALHNGVI